MAILTWVLVLPTTLDNLQSKVSLESRRAAVMSLVSKADNLEAQAAERRSTDPAPTAEFLRLGAKTSPACRSMDVCGLPRHRLAFKGVVCRGNLPLAGAIGGAKSIETKV